MVPQNTPGSFRELNNRLVACSGESRRRKILGIGEPPCAFSICIANSRLLSVSFRNPLILEAFDRTCMAMADLKLLFCYRLNPQERVTAQGRLHAVFCCRSACLAVARLIRQ